MATNRHTQAHTHLAMNMTAASKWRANYGWAVAYNKMASNGADKLKCNGQKEKYTNVYCSIGLYEWMKEVMVNIITICSNHIAAVERKCHSNILDVKWP